MFEDILKMIHAETNQEYLSNTLGYNDLENFSRVVLRDYCTVLSSSYLSFLGLLNGFSIGGFNIYGTVGNDSPYVLDYKVMNEYWKEVLSDYFLIGDSDIDFYCIGKSTGQYCILGKDDLCVYESEVDFEKFIAKIVGPFILK